MSLPASLGAAAPGSAAPPSLVIGVDFGTHASGFAWRKQWPGSAASAPGALRVSTHEAWPDQPTPDAKTRTALLYRGDRVASWGWTAWRRWAEMSPSERRGHSYVEHFKLLLEDGAEAGVGAGCALPPGVTRVQAAADYLGEMRKYIREHLRRTAGVTLSSDDTVWCLTLPAIWSDAAKARMREAAHRAGLTPTVGSRSLLLTLEPEAAALSAVAAGAGGGGAEALADGDVALVLDCGGGTADATLHRVRGAGLGVRLEEAAVGRGALAGGAHVDAAAWSYIRDLLGAEAWDAWQVEDRGEVAKLKSRWEVSKRGFAGGGPISLTAAAGSAPALGGGGFLGGGLVKVAGVGMGDIRLPLPPGLVERLGRYKLQSLSSPDRLRGWVSSDRQLVLPSEVVASRVFDPVVDKALELMADVAEEGARLGNSCNKVLLAGGFARSAYLQARVRHALPRGASLLLPEDDPGAAVVKGAVVYGTLPSIVSGRRSRLSYGVLTSRSWAPEDAIQAASQGYPQKIWNEEKNCYYADGVFREFVKRGQLVEVNQVVKHTFSPFKKTQNAVEFDLYTTPSTSARYTGEPDMEKKATVSLSLPSGWSRSLSSASDYGLETEMRFGATEVSLVAMDPRIKNIEAASINWDGDVALVIGVDFGTHASGFAWRKHAPGSAAPAPGGLRVSTHEAWPDQPTPDAKTRTALLYRGDRVAAWGWTAWKRWSEMAPSERRGHSYVEHFKLLLEDGAEAGVGAGCALPPGVTRVQAAADYMGEMRKYIREHLRRTAGVTLSSDDTVWCLTLPAIWSDAAKARMREAAHRAGLTPTVGSRSLLLTLEPEAAALSAVAAGAGGGGAEALADGDVALVLDCGGGTADATLHRVRGAGLGVRLEEAAVGRGALAGGAHVDAAAWSYMRDLLGADAWDAWQAAEPGEVAKLRSRWEVSKRGFAGGGPISLTAAAGSAPASGPGLFLGGGLVKVAGVRSGDLRLPLPPGLVERLGRLKLQSLSSPDRLRGLVSSDRQLVLPSEVVASRVFDPVVDKALELMAGVAEEGSRLGNSANKVLLAGGFARSAYLQARVRQALPRGASLLLPEDPGAAVVKGAVIFGALPSIISGRRCRLSYGVGVDMEWTSEAAVHAASYGYPEKYWHTEDECYCAEGCFYEFINRGQLVNVDQVVEHTCCPLYKTQNSVTFPLYSTPINGALYTSAPQMEELAHVTLELPAGWSRNLSKASDYLLKVEMRFGATELSLVATDPRTKDAVAVSVAWTGDAV
ncbi:hypothetical protein HYH03_016794 [Edaphochlamys debaryana]|uniref:Uncharacterized protein n=1 Tax=Edaphochlamys debaryana TaxID=47281 RepID=A0A836BR82_9CHLO|nr:hypothetical protein HYH03_016794 [Edaphochlamys debaryana]|eukprot:KAG2484378.1 hypothetical protein HYH03_016794 [Edaphochlamys debaryana]